MIDYKSLEIIELEPYLFTGFILDFNEERPRSSF